ncbi:MAG TPA: hypothetical protein VN444_07620, partial [Verrucomicrobiae bacterium]|nr:hypothetical protein [Verrucomicrobiae bacterium]
DQIRSAAGVPDDRLVDAQREMVLNPHDEQVVTAARRNGIGDDMIEAARNSPVYKFFKQWRIALPLHPEFRTLPMLFTCHRFSRFRRRSGKRPGPTRSMELARRAWRPSST